MSEYDAQADEVMEDDADIEEQDSPLPPVPTGADEHEITQSFLGTAYRVQSGMILVALVIGGFFSRPPWELFEWTGTAFLVGFLGTIPLAGAMFALEYVPFEGFRRIRDMLVNRIAPLMAAATAKKLFVLAILVGIGEELIFRGLLQNWLMLQMNVHWAILISSVVFALCHFISPTYVVLVFGISLYLGYSAIWFTATDNSLNLVPPILIHALYDFLAFLYLLHAWRKQQRELPPADPEVL